ncbi:MAG: RHS repeat-associated core domain-containing protein [Opitutaceae bacterium]|jgi:RHS repeat-associated protein
MSLSVLCLTVESAGAISVVGAGTSDWSTFFTPSTLYYDAQSDEIYVKRVNGVIRQVSTNEAFLDVVDLNTSPASYELRFYNPASASGTTYPKPLTGLPFITYRITQDGSPTKLRITKETRTLLSATDTTAPIARTEWTTIERTGTSPAFTWTVADWTLAGQSPVSREVRTWTGNASGGHDETIQILEPDNSVTAQAAKVHTHFAWGDTPTTITSGTTDSVSSDFDYNTDSANAASYGFTRSVQSTGGAWMAYDYFPTTDELKLGTICNTYAPFISSPASVSMTAGTGVVTSMTYSADPFGMLRRLNTSETRVNGILTSKTTIAYSTYVQNGRTVVVANRQDQVDSTGTTLTSLTRTYQEDTYDAFFRNQSRGMVHPDGTAQSTIHQKGDWNGTAFTVNSSGKASRIGTASGVIASTPGAQLMASYDGFDIADIYIIPTKSTLDFVIRDTQARIARTESYVWDGTVWNLINWTNFTYNWNNQLTNRVSSNGDTYDADYSGELKLWERDGTGIKVSYTYDDASRVKTTIKEGANGLPDLVTEVTYDASDRVVKQETYAASGSTEKLTSTRSYDLAGRTSSETAPGVGATTYNYDPVNRSQSVTAPSLATVTQTAYLDGQRYSVTGTGTVAQYMTYGVETDGRRWSQTNLATTNSPRWSKSWTDWLGRGIRSERPGFTGQANYVELATYDATTGQLIKSSRSGMADTLTTYDVLGQPVFSGLDIDANGTLDLASSDRISGQEKWFAYESGTWWVASRTYTYATLNSATETALGSSRQRLTGFTGNLRSETTATDAEGNIATSTVSVDRTARTVTKTTQAPGLSAPQVEVAVNGLGTTTTAPDDLVFTTGYDVLNRPTTSTNIRAGVTRTVTTAYEANTARPFTVTDPAGHVTATYGYDIMGRRTSVKNVDGKYARMDYTPRGEVARQWGEASMPASYDYSSYGERTSLTTYRTDTGWTGETWPASPPAGDTTTWTFDEQSGLLQKKTDATARYVEYDYNSRGQVLHRYWARTLDGTVNTARVTATYSYDLQTGEPLGTSYNDGTPSVATTYTRSAQVASLSDFTGTRTYAYDATSPWRADTETLPAFYQNNVFKTLYETTTDNVAGTVKGRARGWMLGTAATPAALLQQTYGWNALGRLAGITAARNNGASSQAFAYGYLTDSRLVETLAATGTAFTTTRTYETSRDLLTGIKGQWSTATKSEFTYTHDDFGRRDTAAQSGDAFADYGDTTRQKFHYNDRGELDQAKGYLGTEDPEHKLPGRQFGFGYDAAGNRTTANHTDDPAKADAFTVNELNQLTDRDNKTVSVAGTATTDTTVVADNQTTSRQGRFWQVDLLPADTAVALARSFAVVAAQPGAGSGGTDLAQIDRRTLWYPGYTETLVYDADGNLTSDAKWNYTWDAENRLASMEGKTWTSIPNGQPRQRLEFNYDAAGRRVVKRVLNEAVSPGTWTLSAETRFLYDGWNLLAEFEISNSQFVMKRSFTWGLDLTGSMTAAGGIGGLLQITDYITGASYFPTYDGNGNVATLVNADTGTLGASYEYNAFGEPLRATGAYAKANPFRFSAKFTDNETGLIYYGHRYYDAHNGRFINRDPIEERGGMNLYGFCGNDGVNQWDYLGNSWFSSWIHKAKKWLGKHQWIGIATAAILSFVTYGAASAWAFAPAVAGTATTTATAASGFLAGAVGSGAITATTAAGIAATIGGAAAGFVGGFTSTVLMGGNLGQAFKAGAIGGAIGGATAYLGFYIKQGIQDVIQSNASIVEVTRDPATGQITAVDVSSRSSLAGKSNDFWINGILNDRQHAIDLSTYQMSQNHYYVIYNESHGFISDLVESAAQKLTGTSSISRDVADFISTTNLAGSTFTAHSQGALILNNAIGVLRDRGVNMSGIHVAYNGAAVNELVSRSLLRSVGGVVDYFQVHAGDLVPNLVGGNALFPPRPLSLALSLVEAPLLFGGSNFSPHTIYNHP